MRDERDDDDDDDDDDVTYTSTCLSVFALLRLNGLD